MSSACRCQIIPASVIVRLAQDPDLDADLRELLGATHRIDTELRQLRQQANRLAQVSAPIAAQATIAAAEGPPDVHVYTCNHGKSLPGRLIKSPGTSTDPTAKTVFDNTTQVGAFYLQVFNRDSVDGANMALLSSLHYGRSYDNAFWNGSQMVYGDGDGRLFVDFSKGNDVIAHELTHGVTQYSLQLDYVDDAGGLNESLSDCFGSMFRQWQAGQTADQADWLIGSDIMGPVAKQKGYTCLRDMADPAAAHCLSAQPTQYSQVKPGMDPHFSSGPPNLAFSTASKAAGGRSWETVGKVWYDAMTTNGSHPSLRMTDFAGMTRASAAKLFPDRKNVAQAVDAGWKHVGL